MFFIGAPSVTLALCAFTTASALWETHDRYGSSAQTHQNDDDGLLTHPQDLDAPYRSVLSKCSLRVREAECAHSSGGRGKHVDVQLSHMYVFSHVCILTCMYSHT